MSSFAIFAALIGSILLFPQSAPADDGIFPPLSAIKPDHPRLLLRPHATKLAISVEELRGLQRGRDFKAMLERLQALDDASAQAMVWLLTEDKAAADKAVKRMLAYKLPAKANTFEAWFRLREFALAYDWLYTYPGFGKDERAKARAAAMPLARLAIRMSNDHIFHNYTWMSAGGLTFFALATAGEDDECNHIYETVRQRMNGELYPTVEYLEGLPSEPMGYWSFYLFTPSVQTLLAAQSATESDILSLIRLKHGDWLNRMAETEVQFTLPDLRFIPWGDLQEGPNGGVKDEMATTIDAATWGLNSAHAHWLSQEIAKKNGMARFKWTTPIFYMIYTRALEKAAPQAAEAPLSWLAGNQHGGQFVARSGWGDGDTVVGFRCADFMGNHHHFDQGSFLIYRRGLLAVDPPVYHKTRGPQGATDLHNTLLIDGKPQRPVEGQNFQTLEKWKDNLTAGKRLETGDIIWSHEDGKWAAVVGQFAQAYDCAELQSCIRQLLFIRPGTVVIVDRLEALSGKKLPDVTWLLQLPAAPRVERDTLISGNSGSYIRCRQIQPAGVQPTVAATDMHTYCAKYVYPGGSGQTVLVHVVDVGDGQAPQGTGIPRVTHGSDGIVVAVDGQNFTFDAKAPFAVSGGQK